MIPQETITRILEATRIVDIISEYITLRKKGVNYIGCCPFHDEKTPSFVVSPTREIYKCFGCGASGGAVKFIQEHEQVSFPEAIRILAKKSSIDIVDTCKPTAEEQAKYAHRNSLKVATAWVARWFTDSLVTCNSSPVTDYLASRRLSPVTCNHFGLGLALDTWDALKSSATRAGYSTDILVDASLLTKTEKGIFDFFRSRIIFPIHDLSGNPIAFTGRLIENQNSKIENAPKYLNSRDTELFSKGCALFGIFLAKRAIVKSDECIIVEGNFDVMRMHELGFENTVAPCGTALTVEQCAIIRRFTSNVVLIYDGDPAGAKATRRNAELLLSEGMNVRIVSLPAGEDPDSFGLKNGKDAVSKLIAAAVDIIDFMSSGTGDIHPDRQAAVLREALQIISRIPDHHTQGFMVRKLSTLFHVDADIIKKEIRSETAKHRITGRETGWIGLDEAREAIKAADRCRIVLSFDELINAIASGDRENTISFAGQLEYSHIQELNSLTHNIIVVDIGSLFESAGNEKPITRLCKRFVESHCNIILEEYETDSETNFIHKYAKGAAILIEENSGDESLRRQLIEQCAELLSKADNTTVTINTRIIADTLHLKEVDFKKVLKPFLEKKKSKNVLDAENIIIDGERFDFDPDRLPDYVDDAFFRKWKYFPAQDRNGRKIFYVFSTMERGLMSVGNFYMEPLFHVYDPDPNRNKRVVRINNAETGQTFYAEFISGNLIEFAAFKKFLFNEGGNIFSKGKAWHHEIILASIANEFPKCWELNEFGQQHEGFYAFANAIFTEGRIEYMDDLGLVRHKDKMYYSPAFSKIYAGLRSGTDKYENDRHFIYRETTGITFEKWASLVCEVYKYNNNGHWALLYAIMAAFRSIIYPIDRLFTAPFFIGPTESGKSQVAISIRSLFMHPDAPLFNLNSGTDAAFFSSMERYRDVAMIFEEYNDYQISDIKFQGLKAAVYDGEGKQKKKDASSKDLDISKINCAIILLGQEAPEKDDGSLANRTIMLHVPKKDNWTESERNLFDDLKRREKAGLTNILTDVLRHRDIVSSHYQRTQREVYRELKRDLSQNGDSHQSRLLNTVSLFLAMTKLWEERVPTLKLPFTYREFYDIARAKVVAQSESISSTNRLAVFFETLDLLVNDSSANGVLTGRDFKIEEQRNIVIQRNRKDTQTIDLGVFTKVVYLRISSIHPKYERIRGRESLKMNNLLMYLQDHPAFLGNVHSTRFTWLEYSDEMDQIEKRVLKKEHKASQVTSAVVMNYELLKEINRLDLEKYEPSPFDTATSIDMSVSEPETKPVDPQQTLPF
jgi:DNA primase catalytic core